MKLPQSLQGRLLVLVIGVVMAVWLATSAVTWFDVRHELDELLDNHLAQAAAILVVQQEVELAEGDHDQDTYGAPRGRDAPNVAFQIFHEGRLSLRSASAPETPMIDSTGGFKIGFKTVTIDGRLWRVYADHGGEYDVQVYVGELMESRQSILWAVLRSTLWPMLLALPLLALAAWWAVRRGVAPLRGLGRTLAERQPQSLHPVVLDGAPSEMTPMIGALNGLFGRIGELMESERRFTADAAHELRTPIAAIRAQAEVAMAEADEPRRRHALRATLAGCDRASRLVDQLLTLSRLEAGSSSDAERVDAGDLVRRVVGDIAPRAIEKGQTISVDIRTPCFVQADPTLLAVLVRNLVDNAVRYSPEGAEVSVEANATSDRVMLRINDSGPGMSEADLQRLGERFFRVMGSGQSGSGLGWSIVRRIAAAHAATLRVQRSTAHGGLLVEVDWPAAPPP